MNPLQPFDISLEGINLVEASAGTGKTYNITSLFIRALLECDKKVGEILVVTYTEAATKELRDRLQKRIREAIQVLKDEVAAGDDEFLHNLCKNVGDRENAIRLLKDAVHAFDEASVHTIHGFCFQALQEQAFESGMIFDAELIGDDREVVLDAIDDYWRSWVDEASNNPSKRPLLKLLTDKGYTPNSLTDELTPFVGKPYLTLLPKGDPAGDTDRKLTKLTGLFTKMKNSWNEDREEIFSLLDSDRLKHYRTSWLEGWMGQMEDWMQSDVPPIQLFDKFDKFTQPVIDGSLKKAAEKKGAPPPQHPFFKWAREYLETAEPLQQFDVSFKKGLLQYLYETLEKVKDELQVLSFDDLLIKLNRALKRPDSGPRLARILRTRFPFALVDEFQDTDPIQYEIFKTIYDHADNKGTALFMIGDPKQSIYSFRGADVFAYLNARQDADEEKVFSLNKNFRSVPGILRAIETIFASHSNPFLLEKITYEPVEPGKKEYEAYSEEGNKGSSVQIREFHLPGESFPLNKSTASELVAADTAQQIVSLINRGKQGKVMIGKEAVRAKNIAVLVRTHKQADIISQALQERNVKSVQYSQQSVFQSVEAGELERVLRAVAEPVDESRIKSALATRLMGYDAHQLIDLEEDEASWTDILRQFSDWHYAWQEHGFAFMFRAWLRDSRSFCQMIEFEDGERKLTNVRHLAELLQAEEQENQRGTRGLIRWLARKRMEGDQKLEHEQLRLESDEDLVKVVTMHRSKGLEYPIVFCPFLWHGPEHADYGHPLVFHDRDNLTQTFLDLQGKNDPDRVEKRMNMALEDLAESVRLAYVALTRAQHRCYISWVQASKSEVSPLGYLLLQPEQVQEVLKNIIGKGNSYSALAPEVFHKAIENLVRASSGTIERVPVSEFAEDRKSDNGTVPDDYGYRKFERSLEDLRPRFDINSFTSLMRTRESSEAEQRFEQYFDETYTVPATEEKGTGKNMFTFPRGPQPGTCVHKIFEDINFSDLSDAPEVVGHNLNLFGIDREWNEVVMHMLRQVVSRPLLEGSPGMKLSNLQPNKTINELEFYYRMETVELPDLYQIIRGSLPDMATLYDGKRRGFMKGFIDLTFCYEDRYYILDYKTNYLGDHTEDYRQEILEEEMVSSSYDVQYHIYTIALHRYLSKRIPDYSYNRHIGGAFYLFLRGINEEGSEGIFFDRPEEDKVLELDHYLNEGRQK